MDWLSLLEETSDFFDSRRRQHPEWPDLLLEYGLSLQFRAAFDAERGEALSEAAANCLSALSLDFPEYTDARRWRQWTEAGAATSSPPTAEASELFGHRFQDAPNRMFRSLLADADAPLPLAGQLLRASLCPAYRKLFAALGRWLAYRKKPREARQLFAWAVLSEGDAARYWLLRAEVERIGGDMDSAAALLDEGLRHAPDDVDLLRDRAREHERRGEFLEGAGLLERAIAQQPQWPDLRYDLARLYRDAKLSDASLQQLGKALELNPDYHRAAISRISLLAECGLDAAAARELGFYKEKGAEIGGVYQQLGEIYAERGEQDKADRFAALALPEGGEEP